MLDLTLLLAGNYQQRFDNVGLKRVRPRYCAKLYFPHHPEMNGWARLYVARGWGLRGPIRIFPTLEYYTRHYNSLLMLSIHMVIGCTSKKRSLPNIWSPGLNGASDSRRKFMSTVYFKGHALIVVLEMLVLLFWNRLSQSKVLTLSQPALATQPMKLV